MSESEHPVARSESTRRWSLAITAFVGTLAVGQWIRFGAPFGGDWAQYMSHARALAEGRPYGDIGYVFSPLAWVIGPPVYPPGLPVLLAPSVALFGESLVVPRLLMHLLLATFLVAAYRYFAAPSIQRPEREGITAEARRWLARGTVVLLATSFLLAGTPNVVGSDLGAAAFVWLILVLTVSEKPWSGRRTMAVAVLGAFAINFRIAAAPLIPALVLWALVRKRALTWSPWVVTTFWTLVLLSVILWFGPGEQAVESASRGLAGGAPGEPDFWSRWLSRQARRANAYRYALSETFLYPFPVSALNQAYHLVAAPLAAVGLWDWFREDRRRFGALFAISSVGMLAVLPVWVGRYAWPLAPMVCYGLMRGITLVWERLSGGAREGARVAAAFAFGVSLLTIGVQGRAAPGVPDDSTDWRAIGTLLQESAPDPAPLRVASNRPRVLTWYTRIPAAGVPVVSLDGFLAEAERLGVTRVVISTERREERVFRRWSQWLADDPAAFRHIGEAGNLQAWEIVP